MLSEFVANGELDAEFIKVESEHSAMSACIGASATGARTFTATSSQGLALMSEMLYVASGLRLPIVMAVANRSYSAPLSIWNDWQDSISMRDTGWIQLYCENNQEILDSIIQSYRIAEETFLPVMVCLDGYILTHSAEPVDVMDQGEVDAFLPPYKFPHPLDPKKPVTIGAVGVPEYYQEFRWALQEAVADSKKKIVDVDKEFEKHFGRGYGLIECYRSEDADILLLTMGSLSGSVKEVVDRRRDQGESVGLIRLRTFRPFPASELVGVLEGAKAVAVLEKDISPGFAGALYLETSAAFTNAEKRPLLLDFVCGLGGRDVSFAQIGEAVEAAEKAAKAGKVKEPVRWLGMREELTR
jgi:pyruvate ferredoxin oxidoreductase alpha subunit